MIKYYLCDKELVDLNMKDYAVKGEVYISETQDGEQFIISYRDLCDTNVYVDVYMVTGTAQCYDPVIKSGDIVWCGDCEKICTINVSYKYYVMEYVRVLQCYYSDDVEFGNDDSNNNFVLASAEAIDYAVKKGYEMVRR